MSTLFDIGVNPLSKRMVKREPQWITDAHQNNVQGGIAICCEPDELSQLPTWAAQYQDWHFTLGVHPHYVGQLTLERLEAQLRTAIVNHPNVIAIGETGLDFNRDFSPREQQINAFELQIKIAKEFNLPLYMHERDASEQFTPIIKALDATGVLHCFTGTAAEAKSYLDAGLYLGITGWLCDDRRNHELVEALRYIPLDRLFIETDAPYLLPRTLTPKPKDSCNLPQHLPAIAKEVCKIKGCSLDELAHQLASNRQHLFNIG